MAAVAVSSALSVTCRASASLRPARLQGHGVGLGCTLPKAFRSQGLSIARPASRLRVRAQDDSTRKLITSAISVGNQALDAAAGFLPNTIPKPVAKVGVGLVGFTVLLSLVQAIFNSFVTLLFLGGLSYAAFVYLSKGKGTTSASGDDPLDEARKIMDKYK